MTKHIIKDGLRDGDKLTPDEDDQEVLKALESYRIEAETNRQVWAERFDWRRRARRPATPWLPSFKSPAPWSIHYLPVVRPKGRTPLAD